MMLQRQYILVLLFLLTSNLWAQTEITTLSQITDPNGNYKLTADIDYSGATILGDFTGTLDGDFHKVTGLTSAIFNTVNGGTVKNVILDNVSVSGTGNVGAIANTASGNARIYNCGVLATTASSISGSGNVGSIVGELGGNARVLNCFSYANVGGGTNVAGIVGNNNGTNTDRSSILSGTGSMAFNCIFFGQITSGTNKYPVYGGNAIDNVSNINTYNYFLYDGTTTFTDVNSANGAINKSYFNRFNLYRDLLNSHRDLCAMYINNTQTLDDDKRHDIAIWDYSDETKATIPYLHLERLLTNTRRTLGRTIPVTSEDYKGKQLGTVSCTFNINGRTYTESLPITDMNKDTWDYTWGKIILPFANEFSGWTLPASGSNDYDKIITGWEITSITGGTSGAVPSATHYNFCDPDNTAKDLYANNNYVWAQGGFFVVPNGVTAITFTAHIVNAYYLCDPYPDEAFSANYTTSAYIGTKLSGDKYNGKYVYHTLQSIYDKLGSKTNPADQAIVLVGNYHLNTNNSEHTDKNVWKVGANNTTAAYSEKAATIMSIDADNNQLPDYSFVAGVTYGVGRALCPPTRFDFVCCPGLGVASYTRYGLLPDMAIMHSAGWYEVTESAFMHMTEYEVRPQNFTNDNSPVILNGGIYDLLIFGTNLQPWGSTATNAKLSYLRFGGKVYVMDFKPAHKNSSDKSTKFAPKPVNICGGQFDRCYMTGRYFDVTNSFITGDAYLFSNGGYIKTFMGADQGQLRGNLTTEFHHALIDEYYGGGSVPKYTNKNYYGQITGNISTTLEDCYVKFFVAGPKFGDMNNNKTVSTVAKNTIFGEYYGAGYGGTALTTENAGSQGQTFTNEDVTYDREWNLYTRLAKDLTKGGVCVSYERTFYIYAGGGAPGNQNGNATFNRLWASLSLAQTNDVYSTMTNCTFEHDFYGGGHQGKVDGAITNILTNCKVNGSVFGGGYKADVTPIYVYPDSPEPTRSIFKAQMGIFTPFGTAEPETYKWVSGDDGTVDNTNKTIGTTVDMTDMGLVTRNISTTINGGTVGHDVYGGGNESPSKMSTTVEIGGNAVIEHDVYGGGALADVGTEGNPNSSGATVRINEATINGNVYGGGKGEEASDRAKVYGETIVVIGQE